MVIAALLCINPDLGWVKPRPFWSYLRFLGAGAVFNEGPMTGPLEGRSGPRIR